MVTSRLTLTKHEEILIDRRIRAQSTCDANRQVRRWGHGRTKNAECC
jgi:hypothetical protein